MFNKAPGIGLDIGSKKIKLVQLKGKDRLQVASCASMPTPAGLVQGGAIQDPQELGREMTELVKRLNLKGKKVVSAVAGQQVYTRNMVMPAMPLNELKEAVSYQAMSFLPIPVEEAVIDVFPLRQFEDQEVTKSEVFIVAVRRQQVENLDQACAAAGLNLMAVEIEPLAMHRILNVGPSNQEGRLVAYLMIGASRSSLTVFKDNLLVNYRAISFGCASFFMGTGQPGLEKVDLLEDDRYDYQFGDLITEVNRALEYYEMQNEVKPETIILCGGGSRMHGLDVRMSAALGRQVAVADPLSRIDLPPGLSEPEIGELKHDFLVALGLAARKKI